jgi:nucleoside-diphosphate-sugar epimerase
VVSGTRGVVAITGAYGYLGSLVRTEFDRRGWDTVALVRSPRPDDPSARRFDLAVAPPDGLLGGCDALVHCAYDMTLVDRDDIWRVNVDGARRLLVAARDAGVARIISVSSMSAYEGTSQLYGRAKLAIEAATAAVGGCSVRPGLVYGDHPGGMVGSLLRLTALPVTPVVGGDARQFPVHEADVAAAIVAIAEAPAQPSSPVSVAVTTPVPFRYLLSRLADRAGQKPRFVNVPWRLLYWPLRLAEAAHVPLPFRSDSLLGLVRPAPAAVGAEAVAALGVRLRPLDEESAA